MSTKNCPYCGKKIPSRVGVCPHCRREQGLPLSVGLARLMGVIGVIALTIFLLLDCASA